jgi:mRNA-degrading endonuclease RelE of RelBE toxin-antitoxin system
MKIGYSNNFDKKIAKLNDSLAKKKLGLLIDKIEKAKKLSDIPNIMPLKGMHGLFRITTGDYRLIVKPIENGVVVILLIDYRRRNEKTYRGLN